MSVNLILRSDVFPFSPGRQALRRMSARSKMGHALVIIVSLCCDLLLQCHTFVAPLFVYLFVCECCKIPPKINSASDEVSPLGAEEASLPGSRVSHGH